MNAIKNRDSTAIAEFTTAPCPDFPLVLFEGFLEKICDLLRRNLGVTRLICGMG